LCKIGSMAFNASMSTDLLAGYAAVVATAGVGWQAFVWQAGRRERSKQNAGELKVKLKAMILGNGPTLHGDIVNDNDYAIHLEWITIASSHSDFKQRVKLLREGHEMLYKPVTPFSAGIPGELAGHHGAHFDWDKHRLESLLGEEALPSLESGFEVTLTVETTVGRQFSASDVFKEYVIL
jgi:hypothetical protein